jgi:hypothetical protein
MLDLFPQKFVFGRVAAMEAVMVMVALTVALIVAQTMAVMAIAAATAMPTAVGAVATVAGMRSVVAALAVWWRADPDDDLGGRPQEQFLAQEPSGYRTMRGRNKRRDV